MSKPCECGCGEATPIARYTNRRYRIHRGHPLRFVPGHQNRSSSVDYLEEDRGYATRCWVWQLSLGNCGYGITRRGAAKTKQAAHRYYFKLYRGPLPDELDLHHLCGVKACVNPTHLEPITTAEHMRGHAKLTWDDVRAIRAAYSPRVVTRRALADRYGVSERMVKHILARSTWQDDIQEVAS